MALPNPDRMFPNTDDVGPPGPTGADYADKVAAEGQALWDRIINVLGSIAGSANAITAQCTPPLVDSYKHGQQFWLIPDANNTGPVTIDIDGRGAVDLVAWDGSALEEDDLVAGEGTAMAYDSVNDEMRLMHPTARALLAIAGQGGAQAWEMIGDSGVLGTVAQVEFTFVAGRYSRILLISQGLATGGPSVGAQHSLRNSSAAIVTLRGRVTLNAALRTHISDFVVDTVSATPTHYGQLAGTSAGEVETFASGIEKAIGTSATPPDRVRVALANSSGVEGTTTTGGRVVAWGLRDSL